MAAAMGVAGLLRRLRSNATVQIRQAEPFDALALPEPVPLRNITLRVGVMVHVFYPDLIDELAQSLSLIPYRYTLLVSVMDTTAGERVRHRMQSLPNMQSFVVRQVPNRGRDIAPLLVTFRDEILDLDLIGHVHTKKSLYTGSEQESWRRYLLSSLFGAPDRVAWVLGVFQADPKLGLVYPETYRSVPLWAHTWLSNGPACDALARRLGIEIDLQRYIDFPAGSMFWARAAALRPLFDLKLRLEEFPPEKGQVDGTLQHAVERLLGVVARQSGYRLGILPADGRLSLATEGERNVGLALDEALVQRLQLALLDARLVTFDIFDTLVTRAFLTPSAARNHLAWRLQRQMGFEDFARRREDAEVSLRARLKRDPRLEEIHDLLARQVNRPADASKLAEAERAHERSLLRPRHGVLSALRHSGIADLTVMSDMYLTREDMRHVLPAEVSQLINRWWISCETGLRKDSRDTWRRIAIREGRADGRWLHVGDNEHADIQLPQLLGLLAPLHVIRPAALLDVVPALRPLRHPAGSNAEWPEQLWRGLVANKFAEIMDSAPQSLQGRPSLDARQLGYIVLGPLVLDFLLSATVEATARGAEKLLFLSREGHLLLQAFARLQKFHRPASALTGAYFLASRRATLLPSFATTSGLAWLLQGCYNGTLGELLKARLGDAALLAIQQSSPSLPDANVFLPDMQHEVESWLRPHLDALMSLARDQREAYRAYWSATVGDASAMVIDVGYAGTIQRNLARVLERNIDGYYMALRKGAAAIQGYGAANARYFDERNEHDETTCAVLQHDLVVESLLGAPQGQFTGFEDPQSLRPCFGPVELSETGLAHQAAVHDGALSFIDDVCAAIGEDVSDLVLDPVGVQIPLRCLASGRWDADAVLSTLWIDDAFTGRGAVNAATRP